MMLQSTPVRSRREEAPSRRFHARNRANTIAAFHRVQKPGRNAYNLGMAPTNDWRTHYPFCTHYRQIDGHRMHYIDEGLPENPVLLFVHGNPTWSFYWRNLVTAFRDEYRCIAIDHLGCGLSDKPQSYSYCLERHADNLVEFVTTLDLKNVTLLAHDWGGAIGMLAATKIPDSFRRFVLFNTGAFPPPRVPLRIASCRIPLLGTFAMRGFNAFAAAAQTMASENRLDPDVLAGLIVPYDSWANRVAIDGFVRDIPLSRQHPTFSVLENLESQLVDFRHHPCQLIWGMKDWCFTPECLERFIQHIPNAAVEQIHDAGHWVIEDRPKRCEESVRRFLTNHPLTTMRQAIS